MSSRRRQLVKFIALKKILDIKMFRRFTISINYQNALNTFVRADPSKGFFDFTNDRTYEYSVSSSV
jgi:hypothetical protein